MNGWLRSTKKGVPLHDLSTSLINLSHPELGVRTDQPCIAIPALDGMDLDCAINMVLYGLMQCSKWISLRKRI